MRVKNIQLGLVVSLVGVFLLSACGGGATPTTEATQAPTQAPSEAPAKSAAAYPTPVQPTMSIPYPTPEPTIPYPAPQAAAPAPYPGPGQAAYPGPAAAGSTAMPAGQASGAAQTLEASDPTKVQLASGKVQLVEFFAFWDGISKAMTPVMLKLVGDYGTRMNFIFLDVDNPAIAKFKSQLGYKTQPEFFLLDKQGNILKQWSGSVDEAELRAALDAALK